MVNWVLIPDELLEHVRRHYMEGLHRRMHMRELKSVVQRVQGYMETEGDSSVSIVKVVGKYGSWRILLHTSENVSVAEGEEFESFETNLM